MDSLSDNRLAAACNYMLFDNYNYCFLNHSHESITLTFVIPARMRICRPVARRRASRFVIFLPCA